MAPFGHIAHLEDGRTVNGSGDEAGRTQPVTLAPLDRAVSHFFP